VFALIGRPLNVGLVSSGRNSIPIHLAIRRIVSSVSVSRFSKVTNLTSRRCLLCLRCHFRVPPATLHQWSSAASRSAQRGSQRRADAYQLHGSRTIETTRPSG
jgi:hypothetical protein